MSNRDFILSLFLVLSLSSYGKGEHYLFSYFLNNTTEGQQICYAVSDNGIDFEPLNGGKPVIGSDTISVSGGVRDPHLLRADDGWIYQVATDMDMSKGKWTCRGIVMMRSKDLIHWEHHTVHFPERYKGKPYAEADAVWAPQTIYDPEAGKYMVYFSLHSEEDGPYPKDAVYYAYANADFCDLEDDPQPLFTYPYPTIDTDIVQDEQGLYHLFFNTWGGPDGLQRRQYTFRDLHDQQSWTLLSGHMQPNGLASEGSTAYPLIGGGWMLSYDCFKDGVYQFCRTDDWQHFTLVHETKTKGVFTPRHGSIIQITDGEYQTLASHFFKQKPRILVSTDIGGTDPDDNQSMIHLLMYSDLFDIEGLVSSPSYGEGSKEEILRMIDLYEQDYPQFRAHAPVESPDRLRLICKQGRRGLLPFRGYDRPTEGSDWIIECARRDDARPLWVLVWGSLDDLAQALHDAPDIAPRLRVYYIGGPNKKWGANSHHYVASHFPHLWMIENNATYRGFITKDKLTDRYNVGYYDYAIKDHGMMGRDFANYYGGIVKMGDTPSLLYLMRTAEGCLQGCDNPEWPDAESWGGSFEAVSRTSRRVFDRQTTLRDTVPVYAILEFHFRGPALSIPDDSVCFRATIAKQAWAGYQVSPGHYAFRYAPKGDGQLDYVTTSDIPELNGLTGQFIVINDWPGPPSATDYQHGSHWYTDRTYPNCFDGKCQGAQTILRYRKAILDNWAERWSWLYLKITDHTGTFPL